MGEFKLIVELDGIQHFKQVMNWSPVDKMQLRDIYKMQCANEHGYSIIRIFQQDVWDNTNNWEETLLSAICRYPTPTIILIGDIYSNSLYERFANLLTLLDTE